MIGPSIKSPEELVDEYVSTIMDEVRPVGRMEKMAVQRWLDDQKNCPGHYFDYDIANQACEFFPRVLRHSMAEWAGQPFRLTPWQAFIVWQLQGWRRNEDDMRRFRKVYITVGRKNGKTTLIAGLSLLLAFADHPRELGGRLFCAATTAPQAALLWTECHRMIRQSPALAKRSRVLGSRKVEGGEIHISDPANTLIRAVGADGRRLDGLNASVVVKDEIHEWLEHHRPLHEKLSTAGGSRRQMIEIIITTAGDERGVIWAEEHAYNRSILQGVENRQRIDDSVLSFICEPDEGDEPLEESTWFKANPNLGYSLKIRTLRDQLKEVANKPNGLASFKRYHCNMKITSFNQAYTPEIWGRGHGRGIPKPSKGDPVFIGVDLARCDDFSAVSGVFPIEIDGVRHYRVLSRSWLCKGPYSKIDPLSDPWSTWISQGRMDFQPGEAMDYRPIQDFILSWRDEYRIIKLAYDKTFAGALMEDLHNDYGVDTLDFFQTFKRYTEPLQHIDSLLLDGRIHHFNDPVLTWQAMNAEVIDNTKGQRMLQKGGTRKLNKVDAIVALAMAMGEAIWKGRKATGPAVIY